MRQTTEQLKDLLAKVSPGGWNAECRSVSDGSLVVKDKEFNEICVVADKSERIYGPLDAERQANAKMLALAPELAREVIELRDYNKELVGLLRASLFLYDVPCADLSGSAQNIREDIVKALAKHGENNP